MEMVKIEIIFWNSKSTVFAVIWKLTFKNKIKIIARQEKLCFLIENFIFEFIWYVYDCEMKT